MQGKIDETTDSLTWKAHQTYKDGTIVDWVGPADAAKPASVTAVKAKAAGMDDHGEAKPADSASNMALYLSIAALAISILALILAWRKKQAIR